MEWKNTRMLSHAKNVPCQLSSSKRELTNETFFSPGFVFLGRKNLTSIAGSHSCKSTSVLIGYTEMAGKQDVLTTFGRYQKRLCIILLVTAISVAFSEMQFLVTHFGPSFRCWNADIVEEREVVKIDVTSYNGTESRGNWTESSQVEQGLADDECGVRNGSQGVENDALKCHFNTSHTSVVTEFGLVCEKAWVKPLLVSIYMVGKMVGGQSGGALSDRFGRRTIYLASTLFQFLSALVLSFPTTATAYAVLVFVCGLFGTVRFQASVLLGTELVNPAMRSFSYFCNGFGFGIGYALMPLTAYFIHDWRWWLRFTSFIGVIYIPCYWLIDETPIWLLAAGKKEEAVAVLRKIFKYNGESKSDVEKLEFLQQDTKKSETMCSTMMSLLRIPSLLMRTTIVAISWMVVNMTYYAIALNNDNLSGDWLLNMFFGGVVEMASSLAYYLFAQTAGRRNSFIALMFLTSFTLVATPFIAEVNGTAGVVISMISKFNISVAFAIIYIYTGEMFPTHVRHSVLALSSALSRLGGILSPYLIYADETSSSVAPSVAVAAVIFLSAFSYLWLPKTKDKVLPHTVAESVAMKSKVFNTCRSQKYSGDV